MKRKKWIVSLSAVLLLSYAVANRTEDPLVNAAEKLKAQADSVFRIAGTCSNCKTDSQGRKVKPGTVLVEYFGDDHIVDQSEKKYKDLLLAFQATKKLIEEGSEDRQNGTIGAGKLKYAAMAASMYLDQERRLYLNYLRNLHQSHAARPSDLVAITALNLKLKSSTALTLYFDDKNYQARFNLWHVKSAAGDYETTEYGMSPQDLASLEQQALQEVPTELNYGRLIQFMISRERMTNQWALNRMNGGSYDASSYASCGTNSNLVSFRGLGHGDYYQNLWSSDRADELLVIKKMLAGATFDESPIDERGVRELLLGYFKHWPDYNATIAPLTLPEDLEKYRNETPGKALGVIEKRWQKDAEHAVLDINFPSDSWDKNAVADRVAWSSLHYREKHLIDMLVNEATAQGIKDVLDNPTGAWTYAESKVKAAIAPSREAYLAKIRARVVAQLTQSATIGEISKQRMTRFQETIKKVKPGMERAAQADYVTRNIGQALTKYKASWTMGGKLVKGGKDYELAYIPAKGPLSDRVRLYTPDQLSQFFMKKLYYWDSVGGFFQTAGMGPNQVSDVASDIKKNPVVMRGFQQFLGAVADRYYETLKSRGMQASDVNDENSPLYQIIPQVAAESYQKFALSLRGNEKPKTTTTIQAVRKSAPVKTPTLQQMLKQSRPVIAKDNTNVVRNRALVVQAKPKAAPKPVFSLSMLAGPYRPTMARDATYVRPPVNQMAIAPKPVTNFVPEKKRKETLELYVNAMALLNIGELSSGHIQMVYYPDAPFNKNFYRITSPLDMEHVLNEQAAERNIGDQMVRSLLDQKFAAEIIKKEMLDEFPFLAIRDYNDVAAPKLGDKMINFYTPRGLNFDATKQVSWQAVQTATRNSKGLVEEACSADPSNHNNIAFKNVFDSSKSTRAEIMGMDKRFEKYDETYRLAFRSNWEKFKDDWMDPLCTIVMVATTIALAWYLAPILLGGISSMVALESFSLTAFSAGAGTAANAAGAVGIKALFATLLSGKVSMLVNGIFLVQALVWGHVHCIELPQHLKYQMQVSQSQIGIFSKAEIPNSEIERFNQEINIKKNSTYMMIGFQAIMIPGVWKSAESIFGFATKGALKRLARVAGPESEALVSEMKQMSLKDLQRQEGYVSGTRQYLAQKIAALKTFGKINTLGSAASNQSLRELLTANMTELLAEEPQALSKIYAARVESINAEGARIVRMAEKTTLVGKQRGGAWWAGNSLKEWVKGKATEIGFKNTKYWKMVVADDALDAMLTGKVLVGANSKSEVRAMVLYAYARDLMHERDYLIQAKYKLDMWIDAGALESRDLLKQHFRVFGDSDWARHEELFNWTAKQVDKPWLARINLRWNAQTRPLGEVKRAFKDYRTVRNELNHIQDRFWSWEADQYFANETPEPADIVVDENGYEIIKPLELPQTAGGTYTEILFDPSGLLPAGAH